MQQTLQLNIIPFSAPVQEAEFAFYTSKQDGYCPIHKDDLNGAIEGIIDESELHYGNWLYTDFAPAKENAILISINLTECKYFAQHYYRHLNFIYTSSSRSKDFQSFWATAPSELTNHIYSPKGLVCN